MPKTTTVTLTAAGKAEFGPIDYDESDIGKIYTYTISEDGFGGAWSGSGDITVDASPAALSLSVTLENGVDSDATVSASIAKVIVTKVAYPNHDASGDRKAMYDVTFRPDGSSGT